MSIYQDLAGLCNEILESMKSYQGDNYAPELGRKIGTTDWILSGENVGAAGTSVSGLTDGGGEKLRKARVVYNQAHTESDIIDGTTAEDAGLCDTPDEPTPLEVIVDIDDAVATKPLAFSHRKLMQYCENPQLFMNEHLNYRLRAARERLNEKILTAIAADAGANHTQNDGTTAAGSATSVDLLTSEGNPFYPGYVEMIQDYENNRMNGMPAIIGLGKFATFHKLQGFVCCNDASPYTESPDAGALFYKDQTAKNILTDADRVLMVAPGATQLLTFNENASLSFDNELVKHIVIPDPVYGSALKWDLDFKWDECNKQFLWFARVYFRLFNTFQPNAFPSGSPDDVTNEGVTGIFEYDINQQA